MCSDGGLVPALVAAPQWRLPVACNRSRGDFAMSSTTCSSDNKEQNMGLIRKAMALRVKYRKHETKRVYVALLHQSVHPKNRGGVYPQDMRLKGLNDTFMSTGFVQEEADHAGVCVEEIPISARDEVKAGYETFKCYNLRRCRGNVALEKCFSESDDVLYGTLSHSHLLLILRAWLNGAKWDIEPKKGFPDYCGNDGRLDLTAVADWENAREMLVCIKEGLRMEVLSYKLDVEEPTGSSCISQALNKGQDLALRTTEMTALAVLTGEVIAQQSNGAQALAYETVRERMRQQLDVIVDEPDFIEMF